MSKPFPIDHDLHCHTCLSSCSNDPEMTPVAIIKYAKEHNYTCQCITDHLWDRAAPGPSGWYAPQDIEHVSKNLPLPDGGDMRVVFGCETEYCGGKKIGLTKENYDKFDFIVIPPNHFHMVNFVRPDTYNTEELVADLFVTRLEELLELDLPWHKVGIAHMICGLIFHEGSPARVYNLIDEKRFRAAMRKFAERGTGIEINVSSFAPGWRENEEDARLRILRFAKDEGCKFYLATDAHHPGELVQMQERAPEIVELLGLTADDLYTIPEK